MELFQNNTGMNGQELLADIQGNILFSFKRVRTFMLFVRFGADQAKNGDWVRRTLLASAGPFQISSGVKQGDSENQVGFLLSASGLSKLGVKPSPPGWDPAFCDSSRANAVIERLGDLPVSEWQAAYQDPWDAVLIVACTAAQEKTVGSQLQDVAQGCAAWLLELGCALDAKGNPLTDGQVNDPSYEVFGFRDGISRQYFTSSPPSSMQGKSQALGQRPIGLALTPDPLREGAFGSYFVFRKLSQQRAEFDRRVTSVARSLMEVRDGEAKSRGRFLYDLYNGNAFRLFAGHPSLAEVEEFVRGRIMGRYRSGMHVHPASAPTDVPAQPGDLDNDFDYSDDRAGGGCPFHAHIRAMNARGRREGVAADQAREIVRRSEAYVYGRSVEEAQDAGLLFLCAQADIGRQFEFHQANLAKAPSPDLSAEPLHGPDYLLSPAANVADHVPYHDDKNRFKRYASTIDVDVRVADLITLRGAEYLFAPSLSGLRNLVGG